MQYPKLKHPRICRLFPYVVIIGCSLLPPIVLLSLPIPDFIGGIALFAAIIGLLYYIIRNFMVLMTMDMTLAMLSCFKTARSQYKLPTGRTAEDIRRSILRYGTACDPTFIQPQPSTLRYRFSHSMTIYARGIERIIAAYEVDLLDNEIYRNIFRSAKANSNALKGKKKAAILDRSQKKQPLHRVTVLLILAHKVDPKMIPDLYELLCKQCGDEGEDCIIPCVVDMEHHTCVFNCVRVPYVGYSYAVKNRGIRIIKNKVLGGTLNLRGNDHFLPSIQDIDPEYSLWDLWRELHHQMVGVERAMKRRFKSMAEGEARTAEDLLYLKWDHRGICQRVTLDTEKKVANIESVTNWAYPKANPIGKITIQKMQGHITAYYTQQGYHAVFTDDI